MGLNWLRKRDSSSEALEAQFAAAQSAHSTALAAVDAAQASFDEDGSETAVRSLLKSREAVQLAGEHLARATRLLDAGRARDAEARREALRVELAELRAGLDHAGVMRQVQPLLERQLAALEAVVAIRREHQQLSDQLGARVQRLQAVLRELDTPAAAASEESRAAWDRARLPTNAAILRNAIDARIAETTDPQARLMLRELTPALDFPGMPGSQPYRRQ